MGLPVAFLPGGTSPLGLPVLLLMGLLLLPKGPLRRFCQIALIAWLTIFTALAMANGAWTSLGFPCLVGLAWIVGDELTKSVG